MRYRTLPGYLSARHPQYYPVMRIVLPDQSIRVVKHGPCSVEDFLISVGINPPEVIVSRDGTLIPEGTPLGADDEIQIIRIAHGG